METGIERMRREMEEAVQAGEQALFSLRAAREKLNTAKNWGFFDMLGGGFFSSMIKHSKMKEASGEMEAARMDLQRFQRELKDVNLNLHLQLDVGEFLSFADFFFDNFFVDYMVQQILRELRSGNF